MALEALAGVLAEGKARNDRNDQAALLSIGAYFQLGNLDNARAGARRKARISRQ